MISFPHCKINLGLFVTGKRPDGYHNLETLFYPLTLCDALEIVPANSLSFTAYGMPPSAAEGDNLCEKAYRMLAADYDVPPVAMHLIKKIPVGSGLGGGSSDAVATLKMLKTLFELPVSDDTQYNYARSLGSDCAFFLDNKPKLAYERGDVLEPVDFSLAGLHLLLVVPPIAVSTAEAYSHIKSYDNREALRNILKLPPENWKFELYNDFEFTIFKNNPRIAAIKDKMYKAGAVYASMSGSGSAVYGLFNEKPQNLRFSNAFVWHEALKL